ncbi:MAG: hypothetical protein NZ533_07985 [Casimicrobiaceae bacterium]|nr:hypothetical protein [Casimicrobiaceae bacterium]
MGQPTSAEFAQAAGQTRETIAALKAEMRGVPGASSSLGTAAASLSCAFAAFGAAVGGGKLIALADDLARLEGRLRLTEGPASAARERPAELTAVVRRTRVPVADAYAKMATSLRAAGGLTAQAAARTSARATFGSPGALRAWIRSRQAGRGA